MIKQGGTQYQAYQTSVGQGGGTDGVNSMSRLPQQVQIVSTVLDYPHLRCFHVKQSSRIFYHGRVLRFEGVSDVFPPLMLWAIELEKVMEVFILLRTTHFSYRKFGCIPCFCIRLNGFLLHQL